MNSQKFIDQMGNQVSISIPPQRIVSLVPSQTELLADLGLNTEVVGITKFCIHPPAWRKTKTSVGGTKKFDVDLIRSLNPDLIIGNKEENYLEGINMLSPQYPVWMSDIVTLTDALNMIRKVGQLTDTVNKASEIATGIESSFTKLSKLSPVRTLYLIWKRPWMAAAPGTFIHEMMHLSGLKNCFTTQTRYPELNTEQLKRLNPGLILLSSEPYPFKEKDIQELKELCPNANVVLVDGEMFSWYGSRLLKFPAYLEGLRKILS